MNSELGRHGFCISRPNNVFVERPIQPLSKFESYLDLIGTFLKTPPCIVYRDFKLKSGVCSIKWSRGNKVTQQI